MRVKLPLGGFVALAILLTTMMVSPSTADFLSPFAVILVMVMVADAMDDAFAAWWWKRKPKDQP